jgi:CSLREA domain-containing protein
MYEKSVRPCAIALMISSLLLSGLRLSRESVGAPLNSKRPREGKNTEAPKTTDALRKTDASRAFGAKQDILNQRSALTVELQPAETSQNPISSQSQEPLATTFTVNSLLDTDDGACTAAKCTLRDAIKAANNSPGADTINFSVTGWITLLTALPDITDSVTISGPGPTQLIVQRSTASGTPNFGIFHVGSFSGTPIVTFSGLTISNGSGNFDGGGIGNRNGNVSVVYCTITGNSSSSAGGGLTNQGVLTVTNSTINDNSAATSGGSGGGAGGIYNLGTLTVMDSAISGNSSTVTGGGCCAGGGIDNFGDAAVINSTITGNHASDYGGGVMSVGEHGTKTTTITNSTISGNSAGLRGGGIWDDFLPATVILKNTIVGLNTTTSSGADVTGPLTSQGHNIIGSTSGATITPQTGDQFNITAAQLNLGPLANNGGPTQTIALNSGSIAINAGDDCVVQSPGCLATPLTTDERGAGFPRLVGAHVDVGAFEVQPASTPTPTPTPTPAPTPTPTPTPTPGPLAVNNPSSLPSIAAGAYYSQNISASGGTGTYTPSISAGALPAGLNLSYAGNLYGVPTAAGSYSFTITFTDNITGATGSKAFTLTINLGIKLGPDPGSALPNPTVGTAYNQTITAVGGTAPYTFSTAGSPPAGLTLSASGTLSGTPTIVNPTFSFTINVSDSAGHSGSSGVGMAIQSSTSCTLAVTTTADSGNGSLRSAINCANQHAGTDTITFAIPGSGKQTISLASPLPGFVDPVIVDGYTQPGSSANITANSDNANILIEVNGSGLAGGNGLVINPNGGGSTIRGLIVNSFPNNGILVLAANNNTITGNFLINNGGTSGGGNGVTLDLGSSNNIIGGRNPADRNVITGNHGSPGGHGVGIGLTISGPGTITGNTNNNFVQGNFIGIAADGATAAGNQNFGIFITNAPTFTQIGGAGSGAGNVISGNSSHGISINNVTTTTFIRGNYIGTDATGTLARGNGGNGINLTGASGNSIGTTDTGGGNVISGNSRSGVVLFSGSNGNSVQANRIGTNLSGTLNLGNQSNGVIIGDFASTNLIGGPAFTTPGGACTGACNLIAFNAFQGVLVRSGNANRITRNSIYLNSQVDIHLLTNDLDQNFLNPVQNDNCDADTGGNNLQNYPLITSVSSSGGSTTVAGTLNSEPNITYTVEFFANDAGNSNGYGPGKTFIGATNITTNSTCNASFNAVLSVALSPTQVVTATAIGPGGTSEFSPWVAVNTNGGSSTVALSSIIPNTGGNNGTVTTTILGQGIKPGATVKLMRAGQSDIVGINASVSPTSPELTATFNLVGQVVGGWDVVVTNLDGRTGVLPGGFTITQGGTWNNWVNILGRETVRGSAQERFSIMYGNRGSVDAYAVPLIIRGIPTGADVTLGFSVAPLVDVPGQPTIPMEVKQLSAVVQSSSGISIPLLIPRIAAGTSNSLNLTIRLNSIPSDNSFTLEAFVSPPLLKVKNQSTGARKGGVTPQESLIGFYTSDEGLDCANSLLQTIINCALGFIPGEACLGAALAAVQNLTTYYTDYAINGSSGSSQTPLSYAQLFAAGVSLASCVEGFTPLGLALSVVSCAGNIYSSYTTCTDDINKHVVRTVKSEDPNAKSGSAGTTDQHYITGAEPLRYAIYFENTPTATAPAQSVVVTDQLDTSKFDLSTFSLGQIALGDKTIVGPPFGLQSFNTDIDLRPARNLILRINAALNASTGVITWSFNSIDPATGDPTTDPLAGFLPPNVNGTQGEASVTYTVMPKTLATGTQINNTATVTFDVNAPLNTNTYLNTLDNTPPTSKVNPLPATQPFVIFPVNWSGTDTGSGIRDYTVFVSENGGAYTIWLDHTTQTSANFIGQPQKTYRFFTIATDQANNSENAKTSAEATTSTRTDITNAIDDAKFFVRQHYLDFLSREPDQSGWDFWTNNITGCAPQPSCIDIQRINTSAAYFLSIEFQQTGYLVYRIYKASYGNIAGAPVPLRLNEFLPDTQEMGQGVIVNQGNWQQQLENNKQAFTLEFVQRARFTTAFPTSLTPAQFVDALFANAGVTPSAADRTTAINEFGAATNTTDVAARSHALRDVAENATLSQQELNRAFVLMQYFGYLRRNPNDAPDANYSGYEFWLTKLNQFNGDFVAAEMVKAFITSVEYRQRFGAL